jgi:hypothetical protein
MDIESPLSRHMCQDILLAVLALMVGKALAVSP